MLRWVSGTGGGGDYTLKDFTALLDYAAEHSGIPPVRLNTRT